jgi:hypothetical protein
METDAHQEPKRRDSAFVAFNNSNTCYQQGKWTEFGDSLEQNLSITPYLLTQPPREHSDQRSQYEEVLRAELGHEFFRDASSPSGKLEDEILWPQLQSNSSQQQGKTPLKHRYTEQEGTMCHDTGGQIEDNLIEAANGAPQPVPSPQPVKRKRGRPRLKSPMIDGHDIGASSTRLSSARKSHLEKNRVAASKCRQRKKEYIEILMIDASELTLKNKVLKAERAKLRDHVLSLKNELLRHAGCGSWAIDRYVERCAGDLVGVEVLSFQESAPRESSPTQSLSIFPDITEEFASNITVESLFSQGSTEFSTDSDEFNSLRLLDDYEGMGIK